MSFPNPGLTSTCVCVCVCVCVYAYVIRMGYDREKVLFKSCEVFVSVTSEQPLTVRLYPLCTRH